MTTFLKQCAGVFALFLVLCASACAQDDAADEFDFGDESAFGTDLSENQDADSIAGGGTPSDEESAVAVDISPAVNEVLLSDPKTADELLRAIDILVNLDRNDLAKDYLSKLVDLKLDNVALANLHRRVGSGVFVKLSGARELNPAAAEFSRAALIAAREMQQDPKRMAAIIEQIQSADPVQHRRLARELINAGPHAVAPLLKSVASDPNADIAPLLRTSIAAIGRPAVGPLLAFFNSSNGAERAEAIRILGHMQSNRALPFLTRSFSSPDSDERQSAATAIKKISGRSPQFSDLVGLTTEVAKQRYEGRISVEVGADDMADVWVWDRAAQTTIRQRHLPRDIALFEAAKHYMTLMIVSLNDDNQLRHLVSLADASKVQVGLDLPLGPNHDFIEMATVTDPHFVSRAYKMAMADGHVPALVGLAEALGHIGDPAVLSGTEGRPSPLSLGLTHADARVRFAAASAVVKIGPQRSFAGNSRLAEVLAHFGSSRGRRGTLIAHPRAEVAQTIAGLLGQAGFDADIATTSKETLKRSTDSADYEFILVSDAFSRPVTHQLVQLLRRNPLTATAPIGIMARSSKNSDASMIAELHPMVITLPETRQSATIARVVTRLSELAGRAAVPAERRGETAYLALTHLADLAKAKQLSGMDLTRFVHQVKRTSTTRGLAEKSIEVLGRAGSPDAQATLLAIANQHPLPIEHRTKAADAFSESVDSFGIMLTQRQVSTQYDVYNGSESLDLPTQQLLGSVLDTIENRLTN